MQVTLLRWAIISLISTGAMAGALDDEAEVCTTNTLILHQKRFLREATPMLSPEALAKPKEDLARSEKELQSKLAAYERKNGRKFDLAKCTSEEQVANLEKLQGGPVSPEENAREFMAVMSEPESLRAFCRMRSHHRKLLDVMPSLKPAARKPMLKQQFAMEKQMGEFRAAYQARFKKPLDDKRCAEIER